MAHPIDVYREAAERVPAYRRFLEQQCGSIPVVDDMEAFHRLPLMDKPGYSLAWPLVERCLDGTLHGKHIIMHSSGSSGKYTFWPCTPELEKTYWQAVYAELDANYAIGTRPTLLVLGVLMGGNMSGALFAYALRAIGIETGKTTLITPGRDEDAMMDDIAEFSPHFEQTILYSYPSTAKNVLEAAAARGVPIKDFHIRLRLLGEGYSEAYRERMNALLGYPTGHLASINSGYGATDFRSAGRESLLCVAIKRLVYERGLVRDVLGTDDVPTLCQYDPNALHIEEIDGELVMTRHNAVPLVRYRSGDLGRILSYEAMMAHLADHGLDPLQLMRERGCDPDAVSRNPFVMVTGRQDGGVTFHGTKIIITKVKAVLEETPFLAERLTGDFQLKKTEDEDMAPRLELAVVRRPDSPPTTEDEIAQHFADAFGARQGGIYSQVLARTRSAAVPRVRFVEREAITTPSSFKIRYLA